MAAWQEPLALQHWIISVLAGNVEIFTFLSLLFISGLAAFFRMSNMIALIMFALFAILMSQYLPGIYALVILISGIVTFTLIRKLITR